MKLIVPLLLFFSLKPCLGDLLLEEQHEVHQHPLIREQQITKIENEENHHHHHRHHHHHHERSSPVSVIDQDFKKSSNGENKKTGKEGDSDPSLGGRITNKITAYAVSTVFSGSSGVTTFYTLFLMGCVERYDRELLNMGGTMDWVLSSIPSLIITGILATLELVGMCIPVVDEIVDSVMTFVVPVVSIISTIGTWGLYEIPVPGSITQGNSTRFLQDDNDGGGIGFLEILALVTGVFVSLVCHFIKMLVRLIGEGWATNCLAILELLFVTIALLISVYIKYIAIAVAIGIAIGIAWYIKRGRHRKKEKAQQQNNHQGEENKGEAAALNEESLSSKI